MENVNCLTLDLDPDLEVRSRIEQARSAFNQMRNLLCNQLFNINLRLRYFLTYRCGMWTLNPLRRLDLSNVGKQKTLGNTPGKSDTQ